MTNRNNEKLLRLIFNYINTASTEDLEVLYSKIYVELREREVVQQDNLE